MIKRKGSIGFLPVMIFVTFIFIMLSAMVLQYPITKGSACDTKLPTPTGNAFVDVVSYGSSLVTSLIRGCGPTWILAFLLIPIAIVVLIWVIPFIGNS